MRGRPCAHDHAGAGEMSDGFADPGKMKWVDCHNHRGGALLRPFSQISLAESSPKYGDVNRIAD